MTEDFEITKPRHYPKILIVALSVAIFWYLEFLFFYYLVNPGELQLSLIRSFGIAGTTVIGTALFLSIIFKFYPRLAQYWRIRRYLGVTGFILIFFHVGTVLKLVNFDLAVAFPTLNPFKNPLVFGAISYVILFIIAIISSDFAMRKLTPQRWKFIQRFVYLAEIGIIFHFLLLGGAVMKNWAGYLLYFIISLAVLGQIYWWFKISRQRQFKNAGFYVGVGLLIIAVVVFYFVYQNFWK
ncbi:MAG: ferric reductase-like transmembrane domain-containing protein [Patescibacteria group bacterium]